MTTILEGERDRGIPAEPVSVAAIVRENSGKTPYLSSLRLCAGGGEAEQESLVVDPRSGLTPSQTVDRKLAALLCAGLIAPAAGAEQQHTRRASGSREGAGPAHSLDSALGQAAEATD
jgi:hypothetical protein